MPNVHHWEAVDLGFQQAIITSATANAGRSVAVGYRQGIEAGEFVRRAQVWISADGRSWTPQGDASGFGVSIPSNVAARPDGSLLAIAMNGSCPSAGHCSGQDAGNGVWRSTDATTWSQVALPVALPSDLQDGTMTDLLGGDSGWVAIVTSRTIDGVTSNGVWRTADGAAWTEVFTPLSPGRLAGLARGSGGYAAIGNGVVQRAGHAERLWDTFAATSPDGVTWTTHQVQSAGPGTLDDIAPSGAGFAAVGSIVTGDLINQQLFNQRPTAIVSLSADGAVWHRVASQPSFELGGMSRVVATERGLVAVGSSGDPLHADSTYADWSWWSADGRTWSGARMPTQTSDVLAAGWIELVAGSGGVMASREGVVIDRAGTQPDMNLGFLLETWSSESLLDR
jgi:hypothetical protein